MKLEPLTDDTRRGQIVRRLRELIVSGQVSAGERLTESELSLQLGASRGPLREAIRELVSSGLLVSIPYKGLFVRSVSRKDLEELYSLRTALEQLAFRHCWERRTPAALKDLRLRNENLVRAVDAGTEPNRAIELELILHSWCYELSEHELLNQAWQRILPNLQFYFMLHQRAHQRPGPFRDAHDAYVEYACGDNLNLMLEHLEYHMRQGLERTLSFIDSMEESNENKI